GVERVGVEENFFELGGDSIRAIQLVARARQQGLRLTPRQLFERATVARLAEIVERVDAGPDAASRCPHRRSEEPGGCTAPDFPLAGLALAEVDPLLGQEEGVEDIYPLTPMQEGMLFHSLYGGAGTYVGQFGFTLEGELEVEAFERAWQGVVDLHPALRAAFSWERVEKPLQVVRRRATLRVHWEDWRALTAAELEEGFAAYVAADRARGFDPTKPPLMRLALFRTGEREHRVVWTSHHLVLDGWSVGLVYRDVLALYTGEREGHAVELTRPRPYRDYITWLGRQDLARAEAFWRSELAGFGAATPLGIERVAAAGEEGNGSCRTVLGRELTVALRELSRRLRVTPATVVQGAWALLLSRYSGEEDVVFGATVSGRPAELDGVERMVGNLINTLPLRVRLDRATTVGTFLRGVQQKQAELREYEYSPLPQVQGWSEVERGRPLFESFLSFQNFPIQASAEDAAAGGLVVRDGWSMEEANYPVALAAELRSAELVLAMEYERARFEAGAMARVLEHLGAILDAFASGPDQGLSSVRLLTESERASVLTRGQGVVEGFASGATVHEVIAERAEHWRQADACVCGAERLTYAELLERVDRLAGVLRDLGVGPEVPVGLFLERSNALAVSLLAVLRSGAFYVPLDPAYPAERLAFLLEDSGAPVVLTHSGLAAALPARPARVLCVDALGEPDVSSPVSIHGRAEPDNLAYTIYTSGSTGRPKAVMVSHRSLLCYADAMARTLELSPADRILQFASPSFDVMVEEVFPAWLSGAAVVFPDSDLLGAPGELVRTVAEHGVTGFELPTAFWHEWVRSMVEEGTALPPGVRFVIVGGERMLPERVRQWSRLRTPLVHVFGLTETTVTSTTLRLEAGEDGSSRWRNLPVGRPLANVEVYVLDRAMEPVPCGVVGELYIGGEGVARGYRHRPGLTAERYVPHPLTGDRGRRLYRTGDRVRWLEDGTLEFLGRTDRQVKVRGFRIEPAEVEAALVEHPGVADAVVVAREDEPGRSRLVGYVVPAAEAPSLPALRAFVGERLPGHMVPSAFVILEALPLTSNGKVDHRALPAPGESVHPGTEHVAPRTPTEHALAAIWAEVLEVERVGVHDGYFELGGHSLLAMRVISRVRRTFGVELPLRALFEAPTVAALAARVEALLRAGAAGTAPSIERVPRDGPLPLSFAQQRLWLVHRLEPASSAYNMPFPLLLRGALDVRALRRSLDALVRRHETLRTVLRELDGQAVQLVLPPEPVLVPVVDLRGSPDPEQEAERLAGEESLRPFDLAAGPLLRSLLLRLGEERHILCFTLHHVVSDGWSMDVLRREVSVLYAAYAAGEEPELPELPVQYADYAVWQRAYLSEELLQSQLGYWREKLHGAPPLLELPTDHPRVAGKDLHTGKHAFTLPEELSGRLRALSRREGTTLFMTVLAAWQALLGRYAGAEDVVVGSPVAGRTRVELEGLIGFFVNMLALRARLRAETSWRELLAEVRETALGAYAHQDLPFERLVEELAPERSLAHTPVFQVVFALEQAAADGERLSLAGVEFAPVSIEEGGARFDLNLALTDGDEALAGMLVYRKSLFESETIARMTGHLETLLEAIVADPERRPSEASLLREFEWTQVLVEWNRTEAPYPANRCLHQLFEAQVRRTPDALALIFEEERLTYAELNGRANQLAHHLLRLGVGPEVRVGLCLERSCELVVSLLAVLKAGGAYVPLDPGSPPGRLAHMLAGSATALVLAQERLRHLLPAQAAVRVLSVDAEWARIAAGSPQNPRNRATGQSLAYVIHTSGSTGRPKAVGVQHAALVNHMDWFVRDFALTARDRVLQKTPINFDASVWEFHAPLLVGGCLVVARPEGERDTGYLVRTIRSREITTLQLVPALLRVLLEEPGLGACTSLRQVFCGGEALPGELCRRLGELLPEVQPVNLYGPAECCIDASTHRCGEEDGRRTVVPIGRPVPNTRAYVVDRALQPVPVGVPGELYLGGAQVARGYLGHPALTAEYFLPDPFGSEAGARLYRTGDRVRWRAGGELEYLGRVDEQVKVRGIHIEPGEIEAALRQSAAVTECVVVAREDEPGEKRLVAYLVGEVEPGALRAQLRQRVPEYLVPDVFVVLEALPLTPHGKLDRGALPAPESARGAGSVGPRTPVEEVLAGVWEEVLGREQVGVEEDFFALGGHSLLAMRVISRVRGVLGVELPLRALFEAPTVDALAGRIEGLRSAGASLAPPIRRVSREEPLPLSFAQQRLWFVDRLEPGSAVYNMAGALRLRGRLETAAVRVSLDALVERHEALRTVFAEQGGAPVQIIHPPAPVSLPVLDLRRLPVGAREAEAERLAGAEALRPFDLARGPLLRSTLLRLDEDEHVLLFTLHHVVSDGWSMDVLVREVSALYTAFSRGEEPHMPALPVQYADYAVWQREWLGGEVLEEQIGYWKKRLAGAPPLLEIPTDRPRLAEYEARAGSQGFSLSMETVAGLRTLSRREGATLFMVLLAGWQALLSKYSGQDDVVVGTPIAGRTRPETEGLIGFFVNMLAMRTELAGDPTWAELLGRVRGAALEAYTHQELPFERLVEELGVERSLTHSPLFQATFDLDRSRSHEALGLGDLTAEPVGGGGAVSQFDLDLTLRDDGNALAGTLTYRAALFEAQTIARLAGHLEALLETMVADPGRRLSEVSLLRGAERARVLEASHAPPVEAPGRCVHELFQEQVRRTPEAVAVVCADGVLTYAGLEDRAERLARVLRREGVGPERVVGIFTENSVDTLTALLGTLKAGGCCLLLDPDHPAARNTSLLEDAGVGVVVAQPHVRGRLPQVCTVLRVVEPVQGSIDCRDDLPPPVRVAPENAAYIVYTSGSTGRPKGVLVSHGAAAIHFREIARAYPYLPADRVLVFAAQTFDPFLEQALAPLLVGASIVLRDPMVWPPSEFASRIGQLGVTVADVTPAYWTQLVCDRTVVAELKRSLRLMIVGGEALSPVGVRAWERGGEGQARLLNAYGPTETVVTATLYEASEGGGPEWGTSVPIGRPVSGRAAYVLDGRGEPVPVGVPGELYVGGAALARGYVGLAAQTAEKFLPDALGKEPGARLYRTGDRVRWRVDGELEFLGRIDAQVKVRGVRIEPGEIEAGLLGHAQVREAVVVVREDLAGDPRLVAYVVPAEGVEVSPSRLREHLRERLPEHMVPGAFVPLERLPLSASGKVDRRALPAPERTAASAYVAPRTATEEGLATIFAEVLKRERVGVEEGFFELGGHSLLATRVISRLREELGVEVPLRALFEAPTVAALAGRVEALLGTERSVVPRIPRRTGEGPAPLSFAQQRLWFIHRLDPQSSAYNMPHSLRLCGALDVGALRRSLTELVRRHEAVRTVLLETGGEAMQGVLPAAPVPFPVLDLAGLPKERRFAEALRRLTEEGLRPFDLEHGPLLRVLLVRLGEEEWALCFTLHHIVSDGWSMGVLVREVSALYGAYSRGEESPLPELELQYADYAVWQREWLSGERLGEQLRYWRERLEGAPQVLELPTDRPRPPVPSARGQMRPYLFPPDLSQGLRALCRREAVTPFMALLTAWQLLLARWAGQEDVSVGTAIAGRNRLELEGLIGFFVNTLVLRLDLSGRPTVREVLRRTRETTLGAFAHQDVPFEKLVEELAPQRSLQHTPLFQVMFSLQNPEDGELELGEVVMQPLEWAGEAAKFDLNLAVWEDGDHFRGHVTYRTDLFEPETIHRMLEHFVTLAGALVGDPERPAATLPLIGEEERRQVLLEWNATAGEYPRHLPVHALFERQVARGPDAPALLWDGGALTYAELDARADDRAHTLGGLGVRPEVRVGVCLERGPELVAALLGVLKAGGVYVPLDPTYPAERLAWLLEDSAVSVLLTDERGRAQLPYFGGTTVLLDGIGAPRVLPALPAEGAGERLDRRPDGALSADSLAYVLYTSGSTGRPKGVLAPHAGVVNYLSFLADEYGLGPADTVLQLATASFDASIRDILGPLTTGAKLVLVRPEEVSEPRRLLAIVRERGVTGILAIVPSLLRQLLEAAEAEGGADTLRLLLLSGEALAGADVRRARRVFGADVRVVNQWGATECTMSSTLHTVADGEEALIAPIGRPIRNTRVYVLDAELEPMPGGVPGEAYIATPGLARGYGGRPELTAERFVPDPFSPEPGTRMYRVGDRVRWRRDGVLEFLG
ncbi:MAG TPA: amino acid adenylation domain-containing protein, partial [Longimicrobiaceae bacterium]|nr:amino acid adenylation domain-containing protein [Longimicrobiaceae bacterium]